ncbi:MAG: glycosyltransferase family 2 protein [Bacteroidales bacterium]
MNKAPKISVIMPTRNAEKYLKEAIDSILNQKFSDFEFIIIDDNSIDHTINIINSYHDDRIKIYSGECRGISAALNLGIKKSSGEYIARMDADDISLPERFEQQINFLEQNPDIGICGTRVFTLSSNEHYDENWGDWIITEPKVIDLIGPVIFCHPSVMIEDL